MRIKIYIYTNVYSSVLVNGFVTAPFKVTRSVRQGCGLSPLLYVLCIEPLAHNFRVNPNIGGLSLPGCSKTLKVTQYADDTTCGVVDLPSLKVILDVFAQGSLDCVDGVGCHRFQVCDLCFFCFQIGLVGRAWATVGRSPVGLDRVRGEAIKVD